MSELPPELGRRTERRRAAARRRHARRRRAAVAALGLAVLALVAGLVAGGGGGGAEPSAGASPDGPVGPPPELPGGGREIFPDRLVVGFYGAPQDEALGALGIGSPEEAARRLERQAKPYETPERPVLPAFELLATVANESPGEDGLYRTRQDPAVISRYLDQARASGALLILDIQPGRADFMSEVRAFEEYLREPDVSLALDPEWHVAPGETPGDTLGSVEASDVNRVGEYLSSLVERYDLPEKLLVVHQFTVDMIEGRDELRDHPGVALTLNVDGFGTQDQKVAKYDEFTDLAKEGSTTPERPNGFKLFYEEDTDLMSPREVLKLKPQPDLIVYE